MVEVNGVNEVIATLEVNDNTFGRGKFKGKTNVFNFVNFANFERSDNFKNINSIMKKEYMKPSMEAIEIAARQILCGSGDGYHMDDPQPPGSSMSPEFQEMQELLFDE